MGTLVTFYSYKGGVGRTMALANIATLLASWGKRVLIVDWDLEAPGIEHFFFRGSELSHVREQKGLIDLLTDASCGRGSADRQNWSRILVEARPGKLQSPV